MKPENAVTVLLTVWLIVFAVIACIQSDAAAFFGSIIWTLAVVIYALVSDYIEDIKESVHKQAKAVYRAQMEFLKYEEERKP